MTTKTPHVHAELIKAWADGAKIQLLGEASGTWYDCIPSWESTTKYRVKPEPKPDRVVFCNVYSANTGSFCNTLESAKDWAILPYNKETYKGRLRVTFDGTTKELKSVEMIK